MTTVPHPTPWRNCSDLQKQNGCRFLGSCTYYTCFFREKPRAWIQGNGFPEVVLQKRVKQSVCDHRRCPLSSILEVACWGGHPGEILPGEIGVHGGTSGFAAVGCHSKRSWSSNNTSSLGFCPLHKAGSCNLMLMKSINATWLWHPFVDTSRDLQCGGWSWGNPQRWWCGTGTGTDRSCSRSKALGLLQPLADEFAKPRNESPLLELEEASPNEAGQLEQAGDASQATATSLHHAHSPLLLPTAATPEGQRD